MLKHLLLLCNRPAAGANATTISEHLDAYSLMPSWKVWEISMLGNIPVSVDLERFDAVGIHYTLHLSDPNKHFLSNDSIARLSRFNGLKCVWLHDEYRRTSAVAEILRQIGVDVIFSLAEGETLRALYPGEVLPQARVETVLAGYVAKQWLTRPRLPLDQRPIDVGYRARRPPFWLGALGQEKINIGTGFATYPAVQELTLDISVEEYDRLYGEAWHHFLENCKTVLCVESGASVVDFSGEIETAIEEACYKDKAISFEEISQRYLLGIDGKYVINPVSPRVFEAAATGTVMIAFEGEYSGLMRAWEHYIPLEKDFSNMAKVIAALYDGELLKKIADQAYRDLAETPLHSYEEFTRRCAQVMSEEMEQRAHLKPAAFPYSSEGFDRALNKSFSYLFRKHVAHQLQGLVLSSAARRWLFLIWNYLPPSVRKLLKPALKLIGR